MAGKWLQSYYTSHAFSFYQEIWPRVLKFISKIKKWPNLVYFWPKLGKIGKNSFNCKRSKKGFVGSSWPWYLVHPLRHPKFWLILDALRGCTKYQGLEGPTNSIFGYLQLEEWYRISGTSWSKLRLGHKTNSRQGTFATVVPKLYWYSPTTFD